MRILIMTSKARGLASLAVSALAARPGVELASIVYCQTRPASRFSQLRRNLRKVRRIGLLGALNGFRMRSWYTDDLRPRIAIPDLKDEAQRLGVPFLMTPATNCERTVELFRAARADLGISLGNAYVAPRVFTIPRFGMINIHHELLPEYRGAQSVLWRLYNGSHQCGYTIHQINERIDAGNILYTCELPLEIRSSVRETVVHNYARLFLASIDGLVTVVGDYPAFSARACPQGAGTSYTTPTLGQYLTIVRRHRHMRRQARAAEASAT